MQGLPSLTPFRRDLSLALLAVALLTVPLWGASYIPPTTSYQYDHTEVVATETSIEYVDSAMPSTVPISDEIACADPWEIRTCTLEGQLENETVTTEYTSTNPDSDAETLSDWDRYGYVLLDETLYETTHAANESAPSDDGGYRIDIGLEPASTDAALADVAVDSTEVSSEAATVANEGHLETDEEIDVPETPIETDDGSYYRVYESGSTSRSVLVTPVIDALLPFVPAGVGLFLLIGLSRQVEVAYTGSDAED
ncbi:hypothetical protein SAMN04487967_2160 [Natronorubrum sediminis]|uniref:Uncharacterized protein n=1 Tax=Natronorubrum sediminis TaxID=640943 RepID=A0A1H6G140_9EURY|nr:hypothetical protein [Natronorubrum sediminis]SEH15615.1 hypothetical protein SAMN04487967_2160 [Natronorubrum sediminis]